MLARSSKEKSLSAELEDAEARLDVAIAQNGSSQHTDTTGPSMPMRTCRWNSGDLERLADTMNDRKGLQATALNHAVLDQGPPPLSSALFQLVGCTECSRTRVFLTAVQQKLSDIDTNALDWIP
eukprot:4249170-Amphidinium_carterae.1